MFIQNKLIENYISAPRFERYLKAADYNKTRAAKLYIANIELAQAAHPLITQFEVVLRNSLNMQLSNYFDNPDWIIHEKDGFMKNPSLRESDFFLRRTIEKTELLLRRKRISITCGKIVSEQSLGFWVALFLSHHYRLIDGQPIKIFAYKPVSENRSRLYSKLSAIKTLRNRVNHCDPLCFKKNKIDCSLILSIRLDMLRLIEWIEPDLLPFFESIDKLTKKVDYLMSI